VCVRVRALDIEKKRSTVKNVQYRAVQHREQLLDRTVYRCLVSSGKSGSVLQCYQSIGPCFN